MTCAKCLPRLRRAHEVIKRLTRKVETLEEDRVLLYETLMKETRCHEAANEEIKRLGGTQIDRSTPEDQRREKDWVLVNAENYATVIGE